MLLSMTGFGTAVHRGAEGTIRVEIRSVNHRYLDVAIRAPEELRALEANLRQRIASRVSRGRVECTVRYERGQHDGRPRLHYDADLARQVVECLGEIAREIGYDNNFKPDPAVVLAWPGVQNTHAPDLDSLHKLARETFDAALEQAVGNRQREGESIASHLSARATEVLEIVERLRARRPDVLAHQRQRMSARLAELETPGDPGRIEQELVIAAQRLDIDEELDRLSTHVKEIRQILGADQPAGRRLDFLMQEFNREANTVASKANDSETTKLAIDLRVLIEQMREQIQNVE